MTPPCLGIVTALLWQAATAVNVDNHRKPGDVVHPEVVIPGEWMTDQAGHFLFLPLTVPADIAIAQCKVMTNGDSLLVVVTERPEEEPETNALKKYKLVMEAMKQEAGHDESLLQEKLNTWFETEDDDEVKVHIKAAMESLQNVRDAKEKATHKSISVTLGGAAPVKAGSSLAQLAVVPEVPVAAPRALPALLRGSSDQHEHHHHETRIIKESFAVEIPYPVPTEKIAVVKTKATTLMVMMPLRRKSLEASGISTGGKPYLRTPVFDDLGKWVAGPKVEFGSVAADLDIAMVVDQKGFQPLDD